MVPPTTRSPQPANRQPAASNGPSAAASRGTSSPGSAAKGTPKVGFLSILLGQVPAAPIGATVPKQLSHLAAQLGHGQGIAPGGHRQVMSVGQQERDHAKRHGSSDASLDPEARRLGQLAPPQVQSSTPVVPPATADAEIAPRARVSMEELLPALVKRIAWAGDKKRGSVQMELGAGSHAGTVVTIHADEGRVRVELQGDSHGDLKRELQQRGFEVE